MAGSLGLTDSLTTWEAAVPGFETVSSGYGTTSTPIGGGVLSYPLSTVPQVGVDWATWSGGYTGQVVYDPGPASVTIGLSGLTAFGFEVEPDEFNGDSMTITLSDGESITENVQGEGGAQFFGFDEPGITSITITDNTGDDFAFGNFYFGQGPTQPPAPTDLTLAPWSDSGTKGDDITNVVEPRISGLGVAGDTVRLYDGATLVGTGKVGTKGAWNIHVDMPLSDGQHTLTATESDGSGPASAASDALVVMIDTVPPAVPSAPLLASTAPGAPNGGSEITDLAQPKLTGVATPGDTVRLYNGTTLVGTGKADGSGVWSITTSALAPGSYHITATATDSVGNTSSASLATSLTVVPATAGAIAVGGGNGDIVLGAGSFAVGLGGGDVSVQAATGSSIFQGGNGNDGLALGNGNDTVKLGNGDDTVIGGAGNYTVTLGNGADTVTLGYGADVVTVGSGDSTITLGNGNNIVRAHGGNDTITVGGGANIVDGGSGDDTITVGNGHDTVSGGGDDMFELGAGRYDLSGGGADTLVLHSPTGQFTFDAFNTAHDTIEFSATGFDLGVDDGHATGTPQAIDPSLFSPNTNGTFATAGNRFAYDQSTGRLYYDADGNGTHAGRALIGTLENTPHLTAGDLFFVS